MGKKRTHQVEEEEATAVAEAEAEAEAEAVPSSPSHSANDTEGQEASALVALEQALGHTRQKNVKLAKDHPARMVISPEWMKHPTLLIEQHQSLDSTSLGLSIAVMESAKAYGIEHWFAVQ